MSRQPSDSYRKVSQGLWQRPEIRRLGSLPPSPLSLYLWLTCGPAMSPIAGLARGGRAGLAEDIGWDAETFAQHFEELEASGLARADWANRVVYLPGEVASNLPASPNTIVAYARHLQMFCDCDLVRAAFTDIREGLVKSAPKLARQLEAAFAHLLATSSQASRLPTALPRTLPTALPTGLVSALPGAESEFEPSALQDQDQDQEQEQDTPKSRSVSAARAREPLPPPAAPLPAPLVSRRRLNAAWEWERGCVPQDLHQDLVAKLGGSRQDAEARLFAMYRQVADAWPADAPVGNDWNFWRARFEEQLVPKPTARPRAAPPAAPLPTGDAFAWTCAHDPRCAHRTACALVTARSVRSGALPLADVQPSLREQVRQLA